MKLVPVYVMKAYMGSRRIAPFILKLRFIPTSSRKTTRTHLIAFRTILDTLEKRKFPAPTGIPTLDLPFRRVLIILSAIQDGELFI